MIDEAEAQRIELLRDTREWLRPLLEPHGDNLQAEYVSIGSRLRRALPETLFSRSKVSGERNRYETDLWLGMGSGASWDVHFNTAHPWGIAVMVADRKPLTRVPVWEPEPKLTADEETMVTMLAATLTVPEAIASTRRAFRS